jgi:hypothetical protein
VGSGGRGRKRSASALSTGGVRAGTPTTWAATSRRATSTRS